KLATRLLGQEFSCQSDASTRREFGLAGEEVGPVFVRKAIVIARRLVKLFHRFFERFGSLFPQFDNFLWCCRGSDRVRGLVQHQISSVLWSFLVKLRVRDHVRNRDHEFSVRIRQSTTPHSLKRGVNRIERLLPTLVMRLKNFRDYGGAFRFFRSELRTLVLCRCA